MEKLNELLRAALSSSEQLQWVKYTAHPDGSYSLCESMLRVNLYHFMRYTDVLRHLIDALWSYPSLAITTFIYLPPNIKEATLERGENISRCIDCAPPPWPKSMD